MVYVSVIEIFACLYNEYQSSSKPPSFEKGPILTSEFWYYTSIEGVANISDLL